MLVGKEEINKYKETASNSDLNELKFILECREEILNKNKDKFIIDDGRKGFTPENLAYLSNEVTKLMANKNEDLFEKILLEKYNLSDSYCDEDTDNINNVFFHLACLFPEQMKDKPVFKTHTEPTIERKINYMTVQEYSDLTNTNRQNNYIKIRKGEISTRDLGGKILIPYYEENGETFFVD